MKIPQPSIVQKTYFERLENYRKIPKNINGHNFLFVVEQTRETSQHACSINDISRIIQNIPKVDYGDLELIVLRQPKRKEEMLSPVWGRLIYSFEFENDYFPAIILEALDFSRKFKWTKKLSIESLKELERLRKDGHNIITEKKYFTADYELKNVRATQLYRTVLHEFGHYKHYLEFVERAGNENENYEEWELRFNRYFKLPEVEKEKFANQYAEKMKYKMTEENIIPFEKLEH